jgi:hypothetical protein
MRRLALLLVVAQASSFFTFDHFGTDAEKIVSHDDAVSSFTVLSEADFDSWYADADISISDAASLAARVDANFHTPQCFDISDGSTPEMPSLPSAPSGPASECIFSDRYGAAEIELPVELLGSSSPVKEDDKEIEEAINSCLHATDLLGRIEPQLTTLQERELFDYCASEASAALESLNAKALELATVTVKYFIQTILKARIIDKREVILQKANATAISAVLPGVVANIEPNPDAARLIAARPGAENYENRKAPESPSDAALISAARAEENIAAPGDAATSLPTAAHFDAAPEQKDIPPVSVSVSPRARRGHRSRGALEKRKKWQTSESPSRNVIEISDLECSSLVRAQ